MSLLLPPKADGSRLEISDDARQVTIIGANGSGKTRFTEYLRNMPELRPFRLSAIEALTEGGRPDKLEGSIDNLFREASESPAFLHGDISTLFDKLMTLLLNEEMQKLVEFKVALARGEEAEMQESRLDAVIRRWQQLFPGNHVLREGGGLLFSRSGEAGAYSQKRLSHGERTVLYYFGAVLYAPERATVFVDSPRHVHAQLHHEAAVGYHRGDAPRLPFCLHNSRCGFCRLTIRECDSVGALIQPRNQHMGL